MSNFLKINLNNPSMKTMKSVKRILSRGGLVVFPTETYYAIAVDIYSSEGLKKLIKLKNRSKEKPFSLIISGKEELRSLTTNVSEMSKRIIKRYWPGPLTLIMDARGKIDRRLVSFDNGIALRQSSWTCSAILVNFLGRAVTATSANKEGNKPPRRIFEIEDSIIKGVDLVLDAGITPGGLASTILDVRNDFLRLIRQGPIVVPNILS